MSEMRFTPSYSRFGEMFSVIRQVRPVFLFIYFFQDTRKCVKLNHIYL